MLAVVAIENFGDASECLVPRAAPLPRATRQSPSRLSKSVRENPATGQSAEEIATSCSSLLEILSGFYNPAKPAPLTGRVRKLPLSGRYCDPRDGSVVGGDVLRCIHR